MKKNTFLTIILLILGNILFAQNKKDQDTVELSEIKIVSADKISIALKDNPGAVSLVSESTLKTMPKTIAVDEALRLVPGVRIDNQHNGERVHISIRGQGILTERGLRGIGVLLDGIPLNDPSGFVPDLYDVDWATVSRIQVLRGPVAGFYGSSGAAGIINITTQVGGNKPLETRIEQIAGSYGFMKSFLQINGTKDIVDYRISASHSKSDGYRVHQAFWANNLYEKVKFHPSEKLSITQIISHTDYFHQNPEGLNLSQLSDPQQANPDAIPFNEYQKTNRTTIGLSGKYTLSEHHNFIFYSYLHSWNYKETSNKAAEYRNYTTPGFGIQYNLSFKTNSLTHYFGIGTDQKWQNINIYKLKSAANPNRIESIDQTNIETDTLLANQIVNQQSSAFFFFYHLKTGKLTLLANVGYTNIQNSLIDKMLGPDTAKTSKNFKNTSFTAGMNYDLLPHTNIFVNFSQGFLPPSTEELAANPVGYSGFNTHLVPATANSYEAGIRGYIFKHVFYDLTAFLMNTQNDFFRFKQTNRGNQEVFYGNAGNSKRIGLETYISADITKKLKLQIAYTFSDFKYVSATIDPVYTDTNYVLTSPPQPGQYLPNSPKHQLYAEVNYKILKNLMLTLSTEYQSKWAIYTDPDVYFGKLDPAIYQNWQKGFNIYNAELSYDWKIKEVHGNISVTAKNFTGVSYMAFTEPDPDGNSYQPAPKQEFFASLKFDF